MTSPAYTLIETDAAFAELKGALAGAPWAAIDLEADSLHSYREKTCLMQVTVPGGTFLVDPFPCREAVAGLAGFFDDPGVLKIFHGGDYDVRLLKREFGFTFRNLFDTMIAARLASRPRWGLAPLLEEYFGVQLDKSLQRADWSRRPLTEKMLRYAAMDTIFLAPLRDRLLEELDRLGRRRWVEEECALLAGIEPAPPRPLSCFDVKGSTALDPRQLARLQGFLEVRDRTARSWDRPPFRVLSNAVLLAWAVSPPGTRAAVMATPHAGERVLTFVAPAILEAMRRAEALPPGECPHRDIVHFDPLSAGQKKRLSILKKARREREEALGLPPGLVVNSAMLERLARAGGEEALALVESDLKAWQREAVGPALGAVLREG